MCSGYHKGLKGRLSLRRTYQANRPGLFLDTSVGITGAGLDSSGVRLTDSHRPVLTNHCWLRRVHEEEPTTRKPRLLFSLSRAFLLRLAERQFLGLLFHEPPRSS
jgi:hypothetical protein